MSAIKNAVHIDFEALKINKEQYFEKFYSNNYNLVYRICFSILKDKENSEDITQNVFEKIYKMPIQKFPQNHESSWLYTVAKNESLQFIRSNKMKNNDFEFDDVKNEVSEKNNSIDNVISQESYKKIVENLNKKQEQIISLKIISDFTFKEIGQIMSMPTATVQWYYYSSIKSLKVALANMAMFIIAFIVGEKLCKDEKDIDENCNDKSTDNFNNSEIFNDYLNKEGNSSINSSINIKDNEYSFNVSSAFNSVSNEENTTSQVNLNNFNIKPKIIAFGISGIFLIFTIIAVIIFTKSKKNLKKLYKDQ